DVDEDKRAHIPGLCGDPHIGSPRKRYRTLRGACPLPPGTGEIFGMRFPAGEGIYFFLGKII
ncbi:MAG: hypothetical protein KA818_08035, partial [Methanoculleus sp.]|nr:hypothetical protein [Methanoculleus sp.]